MSAPRHSSPSPLQNFWHTFIPIISDFVLRLSNRANIDTQDSEDADNSQSFPLSLPEGAVQCYPPPLEFLASLPGQNVGEMLIKCFQIIIVRLDIEYSHSNEEQVVLLLTKFLDNLFFHRCGSVLSSPRWALCIENISKSSRSSTREMTMSRISMTKHWKRRRSARRSNDNSPQRSCGSSIQ